MLSNNRMKEKTFLTMLNLFSLFFLLLSNLPIPVPPFFYFFAFSPPSL
ncbi:hypothetical protein PHICD111_28032 [Clostridium phage phiCD111]|uniref:Putative membrane protein n=1 Tax=Clostridium phage phiCD111 TaxID=1582150 RepID=A0A0A8WHU4_9CAUD|nr:hypothetical protein PHICD111_28032 [Clostridium phage phiCD111]CEK40308.1 Putative membrane protein [Clostridium phage phiCD111]